MYRRNFASDIDPNAWESNIDFNHLRTTSADSACNICRLCMQTFQWQADLSHPSLQAQTFDHLLIEPQSSFYSLLCTTFAETNKHVYGKCCDILFTYGWQHLLFASLLICSIQFYNQIIDRILKPKLQLSIRDFVFPKWSGPLITLAITNSTMRL